MYSGFAPSMSRLETSFPIVTAIGSPPVPRTIASSGSGTIHVESLRRRIAPPGPTVRSMCASFMNSSGRSAS